MSGKVSRSGPFANRAVVSDCLSENQPDGVWRIKWWRFLLRLSGSTVRPDEGSAISGGYVYAGEEIPLLQNKYIFGDMESSRLQDNTQSLGYLIHCSSWQHVKRPMEKSDDENTKPISITFSLIWLYLYIEKGYTGRQVQQAHRQMSKNKKLWPTFHLPNVRGDIKVSDVLTAPPGVERDKMIRKWCATVWDAYTESHEKVVQLVQTELGK